MEEWKERLTEDMRQAEVGSGLFEVDFLIQEGRLKNSEGGLHQHVKER